MTSENTDESSAAPAPKRRGTRPTPLPAEYEEILTDYTAVLAAVPLSDHTRRTR